MKQVRYRATITFTSDESLERALVALKTRLNEPGRQLRADEPHVNDFKIMGLQTMEETN